MTVFQVFCDRLSGRINPKLNYDDFFTELEKTDRVTIGENLWIVSTNESGLELRGRLKSHLYKDDVLFISELDKWWAYAAPQKMNWINQRRNEKNNKL